MNIKFLTKAVHSVLLASAQAMGDDSIKPWSETPEDVQASEMDDVAFCIANPVGGSEALHDIWVAGKKADGWKLGKRNDEKKRHPCLIPYEDLDAELKADDAIRVAVIRAIEGL